MHSETRRLPMGFSIMTWLPTSSGAPALAQCTFLQDRLSGLPPVQVALSLRSDPAEAWITPFDPRPAQGRICPTWE